jgi:D-alanine-D-alanine ligase
VADLPRTTVPAPPALPDRLRLVVLYGGRSAEHEISCVTAAHVLAAADPGRYEIAAIGIARDGRWVHNAGATAPDARPGDVLAGALPVEGEAVEPGAVVTGSGTDLPLVVLPLLHGPLGEDGTVQGLLEVAGVPYVGSGVLGSALCMDKGMAKIAAGAAGIAQCAWREFTAAQPVEAIAAEVTGSLGLPCFVKPSNLGSSVGISKAHDVDELASAVAHAFGYDDRIVVEEAVQGREIEVAVLGSPFDTAALRASVPGEVVPGNEFYDYDDKYLAGAAQLEIPAFLPAAATSAVRALALEAFTALRCDGMARVDFFLEEPGRGWLLNEVNTIPGFTPQSMYPKLFEASGTPDPELIDELVRLALARHERRAAFSTKR